jgi:hypothetical protein
MEINKNKIESVFRPLSIQNESNMGSFDGTCEFCVEKKQIRVECHCGVCICEDCRDDWWIDADSECHYCFECKQEEKEIKKE